MALTFKNPTTGNITEGTLEQGQAFADKGFNPVDPTITGDDLKPVQPIDFNEPEPITPFPVADLDTEVPKLELTAPETEAQGLTERLGDLNRQLVGETAFRAGEEETQGLPELQKTQTDLSSQLKAIQSEAKAIPLQLQQEATGRGITAGGLAPLQTARLRTNAIQALGVSALLEASKGNIGLAQQQVDRAVAQKFNPIREEINANINNLNLIIQSPEYSLAQKNRANEQLALQEERKTQLANEEANETEIKNLAITAAQSGADVQTLQAIQNAQTPEEALRIATEAGLFKEPEPEEIAKPADQLQFIVGTKTQPSGIFNKTTGVFTPTGGGGTTNLISPSGTMATGTNQGISEDGTPVEIEEEVSSYAKLVNEGKLTAKQALDEISKDKKQELINQLANTQTAGDTATDLVAKEKSQLALSLQTHKGLNSSVGPIPGTRTAIFDKFGNKQAFIAGVEQLVSGLSLEALIEAKSRGATFGALSEREMQILASSATKIGTWKRTDKQGNVKFYNASEKAFKDELNNINKIISRSIKSSIEAQDTSETDPLGILNNNSTNPLGL